MRAWRLEAAAIQDSQVEICLGFGGAVGCGFGCSAVQKRPLWAAREARSRRDIMVSSVREEELTEVLLRGEKYIMIA